jgi:hypothetical protein
VTFGAWTPLAGGYGTALGVHGAVTAAAQLGRITVWRDGEVVVRREAAVPSPGRPRVGAGRVLWGELALGLDGAEEHVAVHAALAAGTGAPVHGSPGVGFRPTLYAWAPDGERLVVVADNREEPPRAVLIDRSGERLALLWEERDRPPEAAWAGASRLLLGTRDPRVFAADGRLENVLERGVPAMRVEADAAERRLLIAESNRITVWDAQTWTPETRWPGQWLDAALSPSGELVLAVDSGWRLMAGRRGGEPQPVATPGAVAAVALGDDRAVIALADAGGVLTAPLA